MDLTSIPLMAAMKKRMQWLHSNQSVLSQNVSNADTPGYKAHKLEKQDFSGLVDDLSGGKAEGMAMKSAARMTASNERHMAVGGGFADKSDIEVDKDAEESPTGNTVVLEEEMIRVADNQMQYGMVVNLYKKNMGLLKIALGKGSRS